MLDLWTIGKDKNTKINLIDVKLNNDKYGYSLALTYRVETLGEVSELHIPRVVLPLKEKYIQIERYVDLVRTDVCLGMTRLMPGEDGCFYTIKTVKEKTKEIKRNR